MPSWAAPRPSRAAKRNRLPRDWGNCSVSGNMQQPRNHQKHQLKPLQSKRLIPKPSGPVDPEGSEYLSFAQRTRSILYWMPSKETHSRFQVHQVHVHSFCKQGTGRERARTFLHSSSSSGQRHVSNSWQGRHRSGRKGWVLCKLRSLVIRNSPGPTGVNNPINPQKTVVFEGPLPKCMAGKGSLPIIYHLP